MLHILDELVNNDNNNCLKISLNFLTVDRHKNGRKNVAKIPGQQAIINS